jgi:hypothetical protein
MVHQTDEVLIPGSNCREMGRRLSGFDVQMGLT